MVVVMGKSYLSDCGHSDISNVIWSFSFLYSIGFEVLKDSVIIILDYSNVFIESTQLCKLK